MATKHKRASRPNATGRRGVSAPVGPSGVTAARIAPHGAPDIELAFARALADAGLAPQNGETVPADGKLHRFRVTRS